MGRKRKNDNQIKTSAAKLLKQMTSEEEKCNDAQEEIDDQNPNKNALNPLFLFEVLPIIFSYLNVDSLKRCRLVCKLWGFEGGKILLIKSNLNLDSFAKTNEEEEENSEESEQLENFLKTRETSATFDSAINYVEDPDSLENILPLLLQRTTCLSLIHLFSPQENRALVEFLDFFPNLKILHLGNGWGIHKVLSATAKKSLLTKFQSLEEIRLKSESQQRASQCLMDLLLGNGEFAVKEIHLTNKAPSFFRKYLEFGCNWPIVTLAMEIWSTRFSYLSKVRLFLEKISGSLKHLEWTLSGRQKLSAEYLIPWAHNFINPSIFNRLQTLEILCKDPNSCAGDFSWLLFCFALQLRNLKRLKLNKVPGNLEEKIGEWNNHPDAKGRILRSESLEELTFVHNEDEIPVGSFVVFSRRLWPNLKSLWIEFPPDNFPTCFLFSEWIGVERLDLKFGKMRQKKASLWTKWLTGRESSKDGNASQDEANLALKDLKDLKYFGLWEDWYSEWEDCDGDWEEGHERLNRIATDFLVDNSLKFMTQLQSLHLENSNISPQVKEMLKEALGPNVNVEFK